MSDPTISVAMATYNGERFLQEQLDSLARQTLLPYELVVCDDGSTDGTLDVLNHFAAKASFPVQIHRNEAQLGYGPNFLRAAALCSGELIAFCDQDDLWLEEKLQRCATAISEMETVLVIHSAQVVDENLVQLRRRAPSARRVKCLDSRKGRGWHSFSRDLGMTRGCTCVFQSRLLRQLSPDAPVAGSNVGHEVWLTFAAEVVGRIVLLPEVLMLYRQHGRNVVGFRARPSGGLRSGLQADEGAYLRQSEDAAARARLLADAAERSPELQPRLSRAQLWYTARADSLTRRASLYGGAPSLPSTARRLLSMTFDGTYRPISRGGLGLRGLAKDLALLFIARFTKRRKDRLDGVTRANGRLAGSGSEG